MKFGLVLPALALIGAASLASGAACAEVKEPPHALSAPSSSFTTMQAPTSRSYSFETKQAAASGSVAAPQAPSFDVKAK